MMPQILGEHRLYMNIFLWSLWVCQSVKLVHLCAPCVFLCPDPSTFLYPPPCVFLCPPWDSGTMGGVRVPTYRNRVVIFYYALVDILEIFPNSYQDFWDPEPNGSHDLHVCLGALPTSLTHHSLLASHSIGLHFGSSQTAWAGSRSMAWSKIYWHEALGVGS